MNDSSIPEQVSELLNLANEMPYGSNPRVALVEDAVRMADSYRNIQAGYETRRQLMDESISCGRYDLYGLTFSWCLEVARQNPSDYSVPSLLGHYQHVIGKMINFPVVTREQYDSLFADVLNELKIHGFSLRTVYIERRSAAIDFGDQQMAMDADLEIKSLSTECSSVDQGFEQVRQIEHELFLGNDVAALQLTDRYFQNSRRGRFYDATIGGLSVVPLLYHGRANDAEERFKLATRNKPGSGYWWYYGSLLEYLALIDDTKRGTRQLSLQLPIALAQSDPLSQFYCLRPAALLLNRIVEQGISTIKMGRIPSLPLHSDAGKVNVAELREWVHHEATSIASQFDHRNKNKYYSSWFTRTLEQKPLANS